MTWFAFDGNTLVREITASEATIQWRVHVANRKAGWYQFVNAMDLGAHAVEARRRNAAIQGADRRGLVIDPGPPGQCWIDRQRGRLETNDPRLDVEGVLNQYYIGFELGFDGGSVWTGIGRFACRTVRAPF